MSAAEYQQRLAAMRPVVRSIRPTHEPTGKLASAAATWMEATDISSRPSRLAERSGPERRRAKESSGAALIEGASIAEGIAAARERKRAAAAARAAKEEQRSSRRGTASRRQLAELDASSDDRWSEDEEPEDEREPGATVKTPLGETARWRGFRGKHESPSVRVAAPSTARAHAHSLLATRRSHHPPCGTPRRASPHSRE